jgi:antitoxin HicB
MRYAVLLHREPEDEAYAVLVPVLGIATHAETIEQGLDRARELIAFHLESLAAAGEFIPTEATAPVVAAVDVAVPAPVEV